MARDSDEAFILKQNKGNNWHCILIFSFAWNYVCTSRMLQSNLSSSLVTLQSYRQDMMVGHLHWISSQLFHVFSSACYNCDYHLNHNEWVHLQLRCRSFAKIYLPLFLACSTPASTPLIYRVGSSKLCGDFMCPVSDFYRCRFLIIIMCAHPFSRRA